MQSRRSFLTSTSSMATALALAPLVQGTGMGRAFADEATAELKMQTRAIPATGEEIPVIGMGTSGSFDVSEGTPEYEALREVLKIFFEGGGTVIDTAPTYGASEGVMGELLAEAGLTPKTWIATKLSGVRGREAGLAQFNDSLKRLKTDKVELLQVHNLGDLKTQMALCRELKEQGKVRYVGVTHYLEHAHEEIADVVEAEKPDFLQINYSIVTRGAENRLLPMARELGVAVMINRAFEDGKLFAKTKGKELPPWAAEVGIGSWAQAFLRFTLSRPEVTVVIPATGKPRHQADNIKAGFGPPLSRSQRQSLIDTLG